MDDCKQSILKLILGKNLLNLSTCLLFYLDNYNEIYLIVIVDKGLYS